LNQETSEWRIKDKDTIEQKNPQKYSIGVGGGRKLAKQQFLKIFEASMSDSNYSL
jgi:hypothetical protein